MVKFVLDNDFPKRVFMKAFMRNNLVAPLARSATGCVVSRFRMRIRNNGLPFEQAIGSFGCFLMLY